jgi:hypothetical protein
MHQLYINISLLSKHFFYDYSKNTQNDTYKNDDLVDMDKLIWTSHCDHVFFFTNRIWDYLISHFDDGPFDWLNFYLNLNHFYFGLLFFKIDLGK